MKELKKSYLVTETMTAKHFASGTLDVFATPAMVGCMEDVAKTLIDPMLKEGESSVGTKISTTHLKASPVGATIDITATLLSNEGRMFDFEIVATENGQLIGEATHTRASVNIERFMAKLNK